MNTMNIHKLKLLNIFAKTNKSEKARRIPPDPKINNGLPGYVAFLAPFFQMNGELWGAFVFFGVRGVFFFSGTSPTAFAHSRTSRSLPVSRFLDGHWHTSESAGFC